MSHTRRDFLKGALGASTLLSLGPAARNMLVRSATAASRRRHDRDTVLVVVQLSGGNDGLNTVAPYGDDEYARNRPTLRLPTEQLHKIDSYVGFHPRMGALMRLYGEGRLSIVRGVGYPNSARDHERAMEIWHTADPDRLTCQTGWIGRAVDSAWDLDKTDATAVFVGPIARPFALNAQSAIVPSIKSAQDLVAARMPCDSSGRSQKERTTELGRTDQNDLLRFLRHSTVRAHANSRRIEDVIRTSDASAEYPSSPLAGNLRTVAQLIRADIGIRIFFAEMGGSGIGGFDNHANQLGNHCALLHQLSEAVAAFVNDLHRDNLLDRVLLMTFSEFGRTLKENGRRGTGHGAAAPIFLAGGGLKGGLIGSHPSLTDLDNGALKFHTDFRRVYATVLARWLGLDSPAVLDSKFEPVDFLNV